MQELLHKTKDIWNHAGFQKYFKNIGWLFFSKIFSLGISFFVTALVARYLGPEKYGTLMYAVSFVGLFSFLASLGLDQIVYREIIKYPEKEPEILGTAFILKCLGGILALCVTIGCSYFFTDNILEKKLILIISLSYIFQAFNIFNYTFQSRLENQKLSIITIITNVVLSGLKIAVVFSNKGILYLSAILVVEPVLYAIFLIFVYTKYFGNLKDFRFRISRATYMLYTAFPIMFSTIFATIYSRIDQVILKNYINAEAVGLYSSAVTLSEVWYFVPAIIVSTLFPSILHAQKENERAYNKRILNLTYFLLSISSVIAIIGSLFAKPILNLVYGFDFINAYTVLQLYIWSGVGISLGIIITQYLIAEKLSSIILYISLIGMIINVFLNIILIPNYGINGSALATLISYTVGPLSVLLFNKPRKKIFAILKSQ